jgi:hypothetical protein
MNLVFASGFLVPQHFASGLPHPQDIVRGIEYFRGLNDHITKKPPTSRCFRM